MQLVRLYPTTAALATNLGAFGAATTQDCIDDPAGAPDDEATFVRNLSGTSPAEGRWEHTPMPAAQAVGSVVARWRARHNPAFEDNDQSQARAYVEVAGVRALGTLRVLHAWTDYVDTWTADPRGGPWTSAAVNAARVGWLTENNVSHAEMLTQLYLEVLYLPPPGTFLFLLNSLGPLVAASFPSMRGGGFTRSRQTSCQRADAAPIQRRSRAAYAARRVRAPHSVFPHPHPFTIPRSFNRGRSGANP